MTSVQPKRLIDRYSSLLKGGEKRLTGIISFPVAIAFVHRVGPSLAVVFRPVVEQESRRLSHRVDEDKSARVGRVDDDRNAEAFSGHPSIYATFEAKERSEGRAC